MLHELLLSIWGCETSLTNIIESESTLFNKYFHPGERGIIKKILSIAEDFNTITDFIKCYSTSNLKKTTAILPDKDASEKPLKQGLYLQALCEGMDQALEPFREEIIELEKLIIQNSHLPATTILSTVENYQYLFNVLISIIRRIKTQSTHGCALLQCIHELSNSGIDEVNVAMQKMLRCCHTIFYKQLTSWLLYGHLNDLYSEFFIQKIGTPKNDSFLFSENFHKSEANVKCNEMWNYDIVLEMLPSYITMSLATKILSIGQTIIIFGNDPRREKDLATTMEAPENLVWGKKEHEYFRKLQNLQKKATFNVIELENTINELKQCVTKLLWHIAVNDAHLLQQLKLIKDFYLIGRGDLFLDFIKLTSHILNKTPVAHTSRDVNLAFQMSIRKMQQSEENAADNFNFLVPVPDSNNADSDAKNQNNESGQKDAQDPVDKQGWGLIVLQYRVVWPLQLLFSPRTLHDYNVIFRFLLRVRKTQINLWNLWSEHTRSKHIDIGVLQLRNHLIFILDNLQYYLQVDVLESQYIVMENRIKNTENFEDVQTAHATFLANIMSQTFLTNMSGKHKNPVNYLIRLLLRLCDDFILHASIWEVSNLLSTEKDELKTLTDTLGGVMDLLIKTLHRVRAQPSGAHLAQLLLRLDFNRWFSKQM